jgi:outer membrane lipoprotein-sorting protein
MPTKAFALILVGLALAGCVQNDEVETLQEMEETLDQDLDGDGQPER